jgi:iron complex outermembrane receptor protein
MHTLTRHAPSRLLSAAISTLLAGAGTASAQDNDVLETIVVTATRRAENIQDVPFNIAAVGGETIREQGITNLVDISRTVPGLFVLDQGSRAANAIIVRGLNVSPVTGTESLGNTSGDKVSTYVGEIPVYVDLKLADMERVEVLLGPQGTLYGAGTLAGAIRYIPRRPQFDRTSVDVRADVYSLSHSDGVGSNAGITVNLPISDTLAFRASVDRLDDPGFIDANYLVRSPGFSDPEPDFSNPADVAANLWRKKDTDDQQAWSGRAALRWLVNDAVDVNLTYYHQDQEVGGRTMNQRASFGTGRYESANRVLEPNERKNRLAALEITADLGFAELTSATGYSKFDEFGQRDQTDLLITLDYSYEAFPQFSAYTRDWQEDRRFNQEIRLVSKHDGPWHWIGGAFYNRLKVDSFSTEYTPQYSQYLGGPVRPDDLEYYAVVYTDLEEKALFGEISYDITDKWQVTFGARWYDYDLRTRTAVDFPLLYTVFDGRAPDSLELDFTPTGQSDNGTLFKFNTSYHFTDDLMAYFTVSEGYRIGNSNGLKACSPTEQQTVCGQPKEMEYLPDSTTNYEIGVRSQWLNRSLTVNAALYYVDWKDPQLATATQQGQVPITVNGRGAKSQGIELSFDANVTDSFSLRGSYSYANAELTDDAPALIRQVIRDNGAWQVLYVDALDGDRLPGSPEHQGSLYATYKMSVGPSWDLAFNYGVTAISDVLTRAGARGGGEALGGFALHSASVVLGVDAWTVSLYAKNLFNKYAETGLRSTPDYNQTVSDENGDPVTVRAYSKDVVRPREIGLRLDYRFDL